MAGLDWGRVEAVLFDLDGTLLDTIPDLAAAANATLAEIGRATVPVETVASYVGKGIPVLVKRLLTGSLDPDAEVDEAELEAVLPVFRRHYGRENGRRARFYDQVEPAVARLAGMGLPMGCVTNKAGDFTEPLLSLTGLRPYFGVVVSGDTLAEKKPHPLPVRHAAAQLGVAVERALLVGDSVNDVLSARAAGCPVVCVPYGYNEGADVRGLDCDAIVANLMEVAEAIARARSALSLNTD